MRREDTERGSRFRGAKGRKNTCFLLYSFGTADYNENTGGRYSLKWHENEQERGKLNGEENNLCGITRK